MVILFFDIAVVVSKPSFVTEPLLVIQLTKASMIFKLNHPIMFILISMFSFKSHTLIPNKIPTTHFLHQNNRKGCSHSYIKSKSRKKSSGTKAARCGTSPCCWTRVKFQSNLSHITLTRNITPSTFL